MNPEDPIIPVPSPKGVGRPSLKLSREQLLDLAAQGGMPAIRGINYEIAKDMTREGKKNRKMDPLRMAGWYLRLKALKVLNDNDNMNTVGMADVERELISLTKALTPGSEKPKFSEEPIG